ncbi:MAG: hypothetical protein HY319_06095 [Armatimonadetes bacterium]|nr:hypothetical protein [Armatimonadota bacterium]
MSKRLAKIAWLALLWLVFWSVPSTAQLPPDEMLLLKADRVQREGTRTIASGNVTVVVSDIRLDCQRLVYDSQTRRIEAQEECVFFWNENYAASDSLVYNLATEQATMLNVAGRGESLVHNNRLVETPIFFWADEVVWNPEKVELRQAMVTGSEAVPGDWGYFIESEKIEIYPRDKLIATSTRVNLEGTDLYTVPTLVLPLDTDQSRRRQAYFPQPGYSKLDGVFVRNAFDYLFDEQNYGTVNLDIYQKTGLAGGLEHFFTLGDRGGGNIYFYKQRGSQTSRGRFELASNLSYRFDQYTSLGFSYNANQFELPGEVGPLNISSAVVLNRFSPTSALQVMGNFARSGDNANNFYRLYYDVELSDELSALVEADYSLASTQFTRTRRTHYLGSLRHRGSLFDSELTVENTAGQDTYFLNRNPELSLRSHLFHVGAVPLLASASFGNIEESPSLLRTSRYDMQLRVPDQIYETGLGNLEVGAGVRQLFYGNGESQYVLAARTGWMQNFGDVATTRVDYNWQQPEGFTPFQHDLQFPFQTLTGGIEFHDEDMWRLSATAGYDLEYSVAQDIITRLDFRPADGWYLSAATNFDPNTSVWRSVDSNLTLQLSDHLSVSHWSIYDLVNSRLTYQNFMLNFENEDWVGSLAYRGVQNELFFQMSLKAFPLRPIKIGPEPYLPVLPQDLPNAFVR